MGENSSVFGGLFGGNETADVLGAHLRICFLFSSLLYLCLNKVSPGSMVL